jgi:hypothetical protein
VRASGEVAGLVEQHARLNAAEEAYIAVAPDLDADRRLVPVSKPAPLGERFAVRASIAYKGSWVRRTRTFARDAAGAAACARGQAWLDRLASSIEAGKPLGAQIGASTTWLPGAKLKSFLAESCIGSYPLEVTARMGGATAKALSEGTFLVLTVELLIDGIPWVGAAPAFAVGAGV